MLTISKNIYVALLLLLILRKMRSRLLTGFITLECLIALWLSTIIIISTFVVIHQTQANTERIDRLQTAMDFAEKSESLFAAATSSTATISNQTIDVAVLRIDPFTKLLTKRVTPNAITSSIELSSLLTDPLAEGSQWCTISQNENWNSPNIIGSVSLQAGKVFTSVRVMGSYAYATATALGSFDPNFFIVDISDPRYPKISSSLRVSNVRTANDLRVTSHFAYISAQGSTQLYVVDIENPLQPRTVAFYKMPGVTVSGGSGVGNALYYYHNTLYLGLTKASGPEFFLIDVSDPIHPRSIGSLEINATVNSLFAIDSKAYVAATGNDHLQIIDVSSPLSPRRTSIFTYEDTHHTGKSIAYSNNILFLGRTLDAIGARQAAKNELLSFADADTISPSQYVSHIGASVNAIIAGLPYLVLATSVADKELQFMNVDGNNNLSLIQTIDLGGRAVGLDCIEQTLVAASNNTQNTGTLFIIQ